MRDTSFTITREELYRLVWAQPRVELARTLGISDVAVSKWCTKLRIPVPGRGYWAKLAAGHKLPVPPLAKMEGLPERIHIQPQTKANLVEKVEPVFPIDVRVREALPVPATLHGAHPVVSATREQLLENRPDQQGMLWAMSHSVDCIPVRVSRAQYPRALRILNTLLRELVRLGATFQRDTHEREFDVVIEETRITLSMRESYRQFRLTDAEIAEIKKRDQHYYGRLRYEPTGKLELTFGCRDAWQGHTWREGKTLLEDQLVEITSAILQAPVEAKRQAELKRQEQKRAWEEQQRAWKIEEARKIEAEAQQALLKEARAWQDWRSVSAYLEAMSEALGERQTTLSEAGQLWLSKARERGALLNPLAARIEKLAKVEGSDAAPSVS